MRWIPVSERLPTHPYSVLGWVTKGGLVIPNERGMRDIVTYFPKTGRWHQPVDGGDAHVEVSHWMDLPPPPGGWEPGASSDDEERPCEPGTFWLIERGANQGQSPTMWWSSRPDAVSSYSWVESVHEATRFDSAEAAEAVAQKRYLRHYAVTSHSFIGTSGVEGRCPKFDCCQVKEQKRSDLVCSDFGCAGPHGVPGVDAHTFPHHTPMVGKDEQ